MKKTISVILACLMIACLAVTGLASQTYDSCPEYGNVDGNPGVSVSDARLILRAAINLDKYDDTFKAKADFDNDENITVADARTDLRIAINLDPAPAHKIVDNSCVICGEKFASVNENQYELLNSTKYVIKGTMIDETGTVTPMLIARDGNNMYMESEIEGIKIGILVKDGKLYMVTTDHKNSLEFTKDVRKSMELSDADFNEMMDESNFKMDAPDLSLADKTTVDESGKTYSIYTFTETDGSKMVVKMDGDKLISTASYSKDGKMTAMTTFDSISSNVDSSYFALPSNILNRYNTSAGMLVFMGKLMGETLK